ncbi:MAG: efflux RND transporter periplasmic adaptor subunit [Candidatus Eisenbacteria bacterium]|nr:efflux RND transporter periplasmic adaptor subunit [Candidatus Eisenbacteria bacterium]
MRFREPVRHRSAGARRVPAPLGWAALLLLAATLGLGLMPGCAGEEGDAAGADSGATAAGGEAAEDSSAAPPKKPIKVNVSAVRRGELIHAVLAEGMLRARKETEIKCELSGTLDRLLVDDGDHVPAGELIAVLDQREYRAALEEARARHLTALSELAVNLELDLAGETDQKALAAYRRQLERLRADLDAGRITSEEFRRRGLDLELEALQQGAFRRDILEARTGFADAKAAEERALLNLERTEIRAPFDGTIADLVTAAGERVVAGQVLCRLVNTRDLEAEVHVLESDLGTLDVGYPALLTIPAVEQTLPVRVSVVHPRIDTESRTCKVLFRFENDSPRIRPGMFVRAEIATEILPDKLLVPKEAVLERDKRPLVFKVGGELARWVYVQTGDRNDLYVEITGVAPGATLEAGDQVVVSDHLTLAHEALIDVRQTVTPEDVWRETFPDAASGSGE